jgi:hypothetical protein
LPTKLPFIWFGVFGLYTLWFLRFINSFFVKELWML